MRIFDSHTHLGKSAHLPHYGVPESFMAADMIKLMDEAGVHSICTTPPTAVGSDYFQENKLINEASAACPGRIYGLARINPNYRAKAAEDARFWLQQPGIKGIKLSPIHEMYVANDPELVHPILEEIERYEVPVLVHSGDAWMALPGLIADLAMSFPKLKFIIAHMGFYGFHTEAITMARRVENLYLDTALFELPAIIASAVKTLGATKILYGSDAPFAPFKLEIEKISVYAKLRDEDMARILGQNIAAMLGL